MKSLKLPIALFLLSTLASAGFAADALRQSGGLGQAVGRQAANLSQQPEPFAAQREVLDALMRGTEGETDPERIGMYLSDVFDPYHAPEGLAEEEHAAYFAEQRAVLGMLLQKQVDLHQARGEPVSAAEETILSLLNSPEPLGEYGIAAPITEEQRRQFSMEEDALGAARRAQDGSASVPDSAN